LVERLFRISITFAGGLTLLARFLAAALLLTGLLTRRLTVLAGLVLARHVISFQWEHHDNGSESTPFR